MAASNLPEDLKHIGSYLQRAAEVQDRDPIVSYYGTEHLPRTTHQEERVSYQIHFFASNRSIFLYETATYYAVKLAIPKINPNNKATIEQLLDTLEKQKKSFGENEAISNDLVGYAHIENFALKIFNMADNEDRARQASRQVLLGLRYSTEYIMQKKKRKTARNFVAAANYLELLKVFGDVESGIEEKIKYSKWRAAEILKAIRDGRQPAPPPEADKPKTESSSSANDLSMEGFDPLAQGFTALGMDSSIINNNQHTTFSPSSSASLTTFQSDVGGSDFLTIKDFPSPSLAHLSLINSINTNSYTDNASHNPINSSNSVSNINTWNPPSSSPSLNQGQGFYNPAGSPPVPPPHQLPSTYIPPAAPSPAPSSGYMYVTSTPSTFNAPDVQYGYGANNNPYQAPVVPTPAPPTPVQPPYNQGGFQVPSAPFHQPHQLPPQQISSQQPYAPVLMVLDPEVNTKVQKHCKWTISALTYDDVPAAIDNLEKALALLRPYHNRQ
ncbi:hypothetical protein BGZ65_003894 [Modicella reniformis]|uniref:DUF605-domain-containing protein n=1 Tax=Modicella reniformis TaxID=1440133 RepID=A0A9P6MHV5_9FUNG|nr:hypothetical protein BGZ65_003894 [Modicella reniformis]